MKTTPDHLRRNRTPGGRVPVLPALVLCGFAVLAASTASAWTVSTATGDGADGYVQGGTGASTNYNGSGNNPNLELKVQKNPDISQSRKTYLRFDLSSFIGLAADADLTLHVRIDNAVRVNVYGLRNTHTGEGPTGSGNAWSETSITWDNAPANNTSSPNLLNSSGTLLGTFDMIDTPDHSSGPYVFSNGALRDFINNDTNNRVTLILTGSDSIGGDGGLAVNFWSKEHTPSGGSQGDLAATLSLVQAAVTTEDGDGADGYVEGGTGADMNFNGAGNNPNLELKVQKNPDMSKSRGSSSVVVGRRGSG